MKLTQDQQNALDAINQMIANDEPYLVIDGSAGTGKSTLIKQISDQLPIWNSVFALIHGNKKLHLALTATTHKACHSLTDATNLPVQTIQSLLGGRMVSGKMKYPDKPVIPNTFNLIIIDEYSYIDELLLKVIKKLSCMGTYIVFVGDHTQLPPVKSKTIPVHEENFPTVHLEQQVRQETSVLKDIGKDLKEYVLTQKFPSLQSDGESFIYYEDDQEEEFIQNLIASYRRGTSRFISYSNERSVEISKFLFAELRKREDIQVGDQLVNNSYFNGYVGKIKTDTVVTVTAATKGTYTIPNRKTVAGTYIDLGAHKSLFVPDSYTDFDLINESQYEHTLKRCWIDLRPQYACTVHKSQGSTFDQVFIDLTDFSSIYDDDTLARLLYVAMTRAKKKLHVIGHL